MERPSSPFEKKHEFRVGAALLFFSLALFLFSSLLFAEDPLTVINGRVKEVRLGSRELVLSYRNPVSGKLEELALQVDEHTGFGQDVGSRHGTSPRLEDLKTNDPVSVDYQEEGGTHLRRAVRISRVPLRGVPEEISRF